MKLIKKLSLLTMLCAIFMILFVPINANAATVGEQLASPEDGWQRIDDTDTKILYNGTWSFNEDGNLWGGSSNYCYGGSNPIIKFKFYGSKIRLISGLYKNRCSNYQISIDGITDTFSEYNSTLKVYQALVYEKSDLDLGIHTVIIKAPSSMTTLQSISMDAIDIDNTGYLIDYNTSTLLKANTVNNSVELSWDRVIGATGYNIKRSLTPGGPYDIIMSFIPTVTNISGSSIIHTDKKLTPGTYYYTVSVINDGTEGPNSNEVSVTISEPEVSGNNAILEITMTNGVIKEYDLTATELEDFLTWYDERSDGSGKTYYKMPKKYNVKPFLSRYEYISFNKISSFEVKEYNE